MGCPSYERQACYSILCIVYSNNHNTANNNDLSVILRGSLDPGIINFPIPNPGIEKRLRDCNPYVHRLRLDLIWFVYIELWCSSITQYSTEYILWYYIQMAYMTKNKMIYASNKNTQCVGCRCGYGEFRDSVDMGILWGFPQVFLWVWDGYGD